MIVRGRGVDGEDAVEAAHVEHHAAGAVGMAALAVTAAGDRHLEATLTRVLEDGLELLDLAGVVHPLDPGGCEPSDVAPEERVVPAEEVLVRHHEGAEVEDQREQGEAERGREPTAAGRTDRLVHVRTGDR